MPLEKIKVNVMSKIYSGDDSLIPVCVSVKTHGEIFEVLGNNTTGKMVSINVPRK